MDWLPVRGRRSNVIGSPAYRRTAARVALPGASVAGTADPVSLADQLRPLVVARRVLYPVASYRNAVNASTSRPFLCLTVCTSCWSGRTDARYRDHSRPGGRSESSRNSRRSGDREEHADRSGTDGPVRRYWPLLTGGAFAHREIPGQRREKPLERG